MQTKNEFSNLGKKPIQSFKSVILTQAIAVLFFVLLPVLITFMTPITDLEVSNTEQGTSVKVIRYILTFVPWKTEQLSNVKGIRADITARKRYADTSENRRKGNVGVSVATGELVFITNDGEVKMQSDPELAENTVKVFNEFVASKSSEPLKLTIYASWALSYILGGVATFLCGLYVFGAVVSVITMPFKRKATN